MMSTYKNECISADLMSQREKQADTRMPPGGFVCVFACCVTNLAHEFT